MSTHCERRSPTRWQPASRLRDVPAITNVRHVDLLGARAHRARARRGRGPVGTPEEFVLADSTTRANALEEITGARTADDVLHAIFDRFCIGK